MILGLVVVSLDKTPKANSRKENNDNKNSLKLKSSALWNTLFKEWKKQAIDFKKKQLPVKHLKYKKKKS